MVHRILHVKEYVFDIMYVCMNYCDTVSTCTIITIRYGRGIIVSRNGCHAAIDANLRELVVCMRARDGNRKQEEMISQFSGGVLR